MRMNLVEMNALMMNQKHKRENLLKKKIPLLDSFSLWEWEY